MCSYAKHQNLMLIYSVIIDQIGNKKSVHYCVLLTLYTTLTYLLNPFLLHLYGVEAVLFFFFLFYRFTEGRTPWKSENLVAGPLPKHRTTQTQNRHIYTPHIHALCRIRTHDPGF
jgi:hypothetical protein